MSVVFINNSRVVRFVRCPSLSAWRVHWFARDRVWYAAICVFICALNGQHTHTHTGV